MSTHVRGHSGRLTRRDVTVIAHWPHGACRWEAGAKQFRDDVAVNPSDTEEAIWAFMCEARLWGPERARAQFLEVPL